MHPHEFMNGLTGRRILKFSIGNGQHPQHIARPLYFRAYKDCSFFEFHSCSSNCWYVDDVPMSRMLSVSFQVIDFWHFPENTWWYIASSFLKEWKLLHPLLFHKLQNHAGKLPFAGTRTDCGELSEGFSSETATYFVVKTKNIHVLILIAVHQVLGDIHDTK